MVKYPHHRRHHNLLLLLLLCPLAMGMCQQEQALINPQLDALHRNKRALTTICVEIQPNGPQHEPYFMCKGADFTNAAAPAQQLSDPQSVYNHQPPTGVQAPFPSFPSYGAGFFPAPPASPSHSPATTTTPVESHGAQYGPPAAALAASPPPQPYGLSAVSYPVAGGPGSAPHGTAAGPGPAAPPLPYADAGPKSPPPTVYAAPMHQSQPQQSQARHAGNLNEAAIDSRHRAALDDSVLAMPDVGFRPEELNAQYRRPTNEQLLGTAAAPTPFSDDPIMNIFYSSLRPEPPQLGQAASTQQSTPTEPMEVQAYSPSPYAPPAAAQQQQPQPSAQTAPTEYNVYPQPSSGCNSCNRPCPSAADTCPSYQPVIIAMPCFGHQQPTHYLAVPGNPALQSSTALPRESMLGSPYGAPYGMAPQVGAPFGMAPQVGAPFGMAAPQVGSPYGVGPQVGAPFGLSPMLNPFGPFGSLNPFNPFNRILGTAPATTPQPRLRLFGAPEEAVTHAAAATTAAPKKLLPLPTPTTASTTEEVILGASKEVAAGEGDDEEAEHLGDTTEPADAAETTEDDAELSKSIETKDDQAEELIKKGEETLKNDKPKRQYPPYSSSNKTQKRRYFHRL